MPPLVKKLLHVCIAVHDLDAALHFYQDVLGFHSVFETDNASADGILLGFARDTVSLKAHHVMTIGAHGQDATEINLVEYVDPATTSRAGSPREMNEAGLSRLALLVDDLDEAFHKIASFQGVEIVSRPRQIAISEATATPAPRWFSFRDPFGVFIAVTGPDHTNPEEK